MDSIAIIGSGEMAVVIIENAKKMHLETHCFSNDPTDKAVKVCDFYHQISIFEIDDIVNECRRFNAKGVLSTTELTIPVAAKVATLLGLPHMDVSISEIITDKGYVRKKAKNVSSINQPNFVLVEKNGEVPHINRYPVIVKPTSMGGKRGVTVVNSDKELRSALEYAALSMPKEKNEIIIEDFVAGGKEYSVESLSFCNKHYVIQITEKISSGPPHCVELGHLQPADLDSNMRQKVEKAISELLTSTGVNNSASHTEIKIVDNEIYLIELNARLGGDHIAYPLTELSTGYNYIQGLISISMGQFTAPDKDTFKDTSCGVIFISKQTERFSSLYEKCEDYKWLYKKNKATDEMIEILINHSFDTNYMIFLSDNNEIPEEIRSLL